MKRAAVTARPASPQVDRKKARVTVAALVETPPEWVTVKLLTDSGQTFLLTSNRDFQRAAMQWCYVVRNRRRWASVKATRDEQAKRAQELLLVLLKPEIGFDDTNREELREAAMADLNKLASADIIEVSIPYYKEKHGWEARIFPWEYLLSAATEGLRGDRGLMVVRHLDCHNERAPSADRAPKKLLLVESAPAQLRKKFSFDTERSLVKANLKLPHDERSEDETRDMLRARVVKAAPDVIHLTGVDAHQGESLQVIERVERNDDGYLMRGADSAVEAIGAASLGDVLSAAATKPLLISCTIYNSAARICPMLIAAGARAAIGIQDEFDDALVERFFTNFYQAWRLSNWDVLEAFYLSLTALREQPQGLAGTGVVLWSDTSLLGAEARQARPAVNAPEEVKSRLLAMQAEKQNDITLKWWKDKGTGSLDDLLKVKIEPYRAINYSMLHNDRDIFKMFSISKLQTGRVRGISVEVLLFVGLESFKYTTTIDLEESSLEIQDRIRVPLIYARDTQTRESIHTSLQVEVKWGDERICRDTYRVTLLPLNEWRDDDTDRIWLPSFVQPLDRSVGKIIDAAQPYLITLQDYSGAGFDGYQSVDPEMDNPTEGVDLQVQAIWWALVNDFPLGYINPPPAYSALSKQQKGEAPPTQRLRMPYDIIEGRRGTCIDLALLLASCLEYVEIYPVIFLLTGHAFPGYWRSDVDYQAFQLSLCGDLLAADEDQSAAAPSPGATPTAPWSLNNDLYTEVMRHVRDQKLVPLESTLLTSRGGFWEAVDEGMKNLRSKREFHSLIDIKLARAHRVTPIPIRGGHNGR